MDHAVKYINDAVALVCYFVLFPSVACLKYNSVNESSTVIQSVSFLKLLFPHMCVCVCV
jgi:hypothetical protein